MPRPRPSIVATFWTRMERWKSGQDRRAAHRHGDRQPADGERKQRRHEAPESRQEQEQCDRENPQLRRAGVVRAGLSEVEIQGCPPVHCIRTAG